MKSVFILMLLGLFLVGCNKDKVMSSDSVILNYYQSNGNFLILVIGDTLESAYEYDLSIVQLNNDSLPLYYDSEPDGAGMYNYVYWKLQPNTDTLYWTHPQSYEFLEDEINSNLLSTNALVAYDPNQFQMVESTNANVEDLWTHISCLDIVNEYRASSPTSKIGISRQVFSIYDEQLGFMVPQEKHLFFISK